MLTELKLTNFRIFDDEVTVRFRPITILIGRNSSGKSSIIKFLLMLQQSMGPGKTQFLSPEGDLVNLGVFAELKNVLTEKSCLEFELSTKILFDRPNPITLGLIGASGDYDTGKLLYKTGATVPYVEETIDVANAPKAVTSLVDETSGTVVLKYEKDTGIANFGDYPPLHEIIEDLAHFGASELSEKDKLEQVDAPTNRFKLGLFFDMSSQVDFISRLRHQITSIRHITPVRDEARRVIVDAPPPLDNVGQRGQYALPHLQRIVSDRGEKYGFLFPHLRSVAGIDEVNFSESDRYISHALARNNSTGANVHIADYGFGVSQCLPIFVQGAIMPPYTTLMVEQPEAQLHPTAQLEMGSYFADLWQQRQVGAIIETHSDNILLRLRHLIALGKLTSQDVSVAYFTFDENNRGMPTVKNLDINPDGSLEAGLPMEFFGADVIEGLKLRAGV